MKSSLKIKYKLQDKVRSSKIMLFWYKHLYKPFKFITNAISWSFFLILIMFAAFLIYYYVSLQTYRVKGVGYEPKISLFRIISGSMEPTINIYDVILVLKKNDPEEIKVDDIISFNSDKFLIGQTISVTHRVVEIARDNNGEYLYYTKGDNTLSRDPDPVSFSDISGVVSLKIPQLGRLQFFLASEIGWLLVIVIPALFIVVKYVIELLNLPLIMSKLDKNGKFMPLYTKRYLLTYKPNKNVEKVETSKSKK